MSPIHHRNQTQRAPLPPPESFMHVILTWLERASPGWLQLRGISFKELRRVLCKLHSLGVKPRYDWDKESRTAVLRMPTNIHEAVGEFFSFEVATRINHLIKQASIRGDPSVSPMGSPEPRVGPSTGEEVSIVCPDQCLHFTQCGADEQLVYVQDTPRVIAETAWSHVMAKVLSCLFEMRGLQAAVVCDMKNIPPVAVHGGKSSSKVAKPFLAEIAVWTRKTVRPLDLDPCYHREELSDHKVGDAVSFSGGLALEQSHISSSSPVEGEQFDERAREYFRKDPKHPDQRQSIVRRSEDWITLYDAGIPIARGEPEPELVFDVYDFLRPCSRFPRSYISDRKIPIPLGDLRRELVLALQARQNVSGHYPVPKSGSLTRAFGPSQGLHARKGQLSSVRTHPIEMNLRRGLFTSATSRLLGTRSTRSWTATRSVGTLSSTPCRPICQGTPETTAILFPSRLFARNRPIRAAPLFDRLLVPGAGPRMPFRFTPH